MSDDKPQGTASQQEVRRLKLLGGGSGLGIAGGFAAMMREMVVGNLMCKLREWQKDGKGLKAVLEDIADEHIEMVMEASLQHRPEDVRHLLKQLPTDEARLEYLQALDVCHRCGATPRSSACRGQAG